METPFSPEPVAKFFGTNWTPATTHAEPVDDPKVGSYTSINFRESSFNQSVREVVSTVVFVGIATDAGIAVVVPRRLDRHGDTNPQNIAMSTGETC